jgi:hypothetical protein
MKKYLLYTLILPFASCTIQQPITREPAQNNKEYVVEYLFEHDGCKVYRFYDRGDYIYFTNCRGETIAKTDSTEARNITTIRK